MREKKVLLGLGLVGLALATVAPSCGGDDNGATDGPDGSTPDGDGDGPGTDGPGSDGPGPDGPGPEGPGGDAPNPANACVPVRVARCIRHHRGPPRCAKRDVLAGRGDKAVMTRRALRGRMEQRRRWRVLSRNHRHNRQIDGHDAQNESGHDYHPVTRFPSNQSHRKYMTNCVERPARSFTGIRTPALSMMC